MNVFEVFEKRVRTALADDADVVIELGRPVRDGKLWTLTIMFRDGFEIEIGYSRHRGYGLSAGYDLQFGSGFDEIVDDGDQAFDRIISLASNKVPTDVDQPLNLSELRRAVGVPQSQLATIVGMTKGGMAQLENDQPINSMRVGTIEKVVHGLGGRLLVIAEFPNGKSRKIKIDRELEGG